MFFVLFFSSGEHLGFFTTVFRVFSLLIAFFHVTNFLYPDCFFAVFFVRYVVFVLLYGECYGFERAFFTIRCVLTYTPSPHLPQYRKCYGSEREFLILGVSLPYSPSQHLAQQDGAPTCFQGFPGSRQFFIEVAGPPNCGSKHRPAHLFV